jgi:hypothetical protein
MNGAHAKSVFSPSGKTECCDATEADKTRANTRYHAGCIQHEGELPSGGMILRCAAPGFIMTAQG